jgi:ATP-dependent Clp protease adaptor protein ClpS
MPLPRACSRRIRCRPEPYPAVPCRADGGGLPCDTGRLTVLETTTRTAPVEVDRPADEDVVVPDRVWLVIVWNDPINLMSYVTYVFQKLFGYSKAKAEKLMLDVHHKGRAVVSSGARERAEWDVSRLHAHGLWATMQHDT